MAALVAVKPLSLRPALGFGYSGRQQQFSLRTRVAVPRRRLPPFLRCSAEEKPEPEVTEKSEVKPEAAENNGHSAIEEEFGGWNTVAPEPESEGSWKAGMSIDPFLPLRCFSFLVTMSWRDST